MTELSKIEQGDGLSAKQRAFVDEVMKGTELSEARDIAGYSETTHPNVILGSAVVKAALRRGCDAELDGPIRVAAMLKLKHLVTADGIPHATAFNAAKLIIERGDGNGDNGDDKPLSEMTPAELERMIDRLKSEREAGIIDVTPSNGAQR